MNNRSRPDEVLVQKGRGSANFSDELPPYMVLGPSHVWNGVAHVLCSVTQQSPGLLLQTVVVGQTSKIGLNTNWPTPWSRTFLRNTRMWRCGTVIPRWARSRRFSSDWLRGSSVSRNGRSFYDMSVLDVFYSVDLWVLVLQDCDWEMWFF